MNGLYTQIGRVRSVNPARREVRINAPKRRMNDLEGWSWLYVEESSGEIVRFKVVGVALRSGYAAITLAPGVPRDTVASLKGRRVVVPEAESKPVGAFDIAAAELTGMSIETVDGTLVGEIVAGFETKANGVLEVLRPDGSSLLLPLIPEVIEEFNLDRRKVIVGDIAPFAVEHDSGTRLA